TGEEADAGVLAVLGDAVLLFQLLVLATQFAGDAHGKVVGEREEELGAKRLEQRAPGVAGQGGAERADALRGDDRDAARLARETEELLVAAGVAFSDGGEGMILVAQEHHLAPV